MSGLTDLLCTSDRFRCDDPRQTGAKGKEPVFPWAPNGKTDSGEESCANEPFRFNCSPGNLFFFWYHKLEQLLSNGNRSSSKVSLLILCPLTCEPSFQNSIWKHYSLVTVKIFLKWIIYHFTAIKWVDVSWPFYLLMESFVVGEKKMNGRKITLLLFEYWILTTYNKTALQEVKKYFKI